MRERQDVLAPLPDRKRAKDPTGNAVIEVEPEAAAPDKVAEVSIGGADEPEVSFQPHVPPTRL